MATTTTTTQASAPTPTRPGRIVVTTSRLSQPLVLHQDVVNPAWNTFKTVMVYVGGILFFVVLGGVMFMLGSRGAVSVAPTPAPIVITVPASAPTAGTATPSSPWDLPSNK